MSTIPDSHLSNQDLAPTGPEQRTPGTYNLAALWLSMNSPDFTRYAKDQRSQVVGQAIAMPLTLGR
jgi:cytosine/uracil/thiamine/allantoin permease